MDEVPELDTIDVYLDEDLKKKQKPRCKDSFLNYLCEDNLEEIPQWDEENDNIESDDEEVGVEGDANEEEGGLNSDEDKAEIESSIHNPSVKWNKQRPLLGERYESLKQLKVCLTNYAVSNGYVIKFKKSDSVRVVAVCGSVSNKVQCPYMVRASWMSTERSFQIKKFVDKHTCVRGFKTAPLMNPTWIARHFLKDLIRTPDLKCKTMQVVMQSKFHTKVSWSKCYRARCRAMSLIEGKLTDHYARVWDYAQELLRSNPGSTCKVSVTPNPDGSTTFQRFYICFKSIKEGWKRGCRRVIGLDGSFLKGRCKGELLTAIRRDANNQVYPIAWAVVDIENKENWKWFLELVDGDLGLDGGRGACVISDQHKGLVEATKDILPHVEHRQCARHIYANFRKVYTGVEFRNMFWAAATSTVVGDFMINMEKIKAISPTAYDHLMARQPHSWCKAYLRNGLACEAIENGIAECFNAIIVDARKRPILTMLEDIRLYISWKRFFNLKETAEKWDSEVCPAVTTVKIGQQKSISQSLVNDL